MTTNNTLLAESYEAAADYIEKNGWCRDQLAPHLPPTYNVATVMMAIRQQQQPVCLMGAAYAVGVPFFSSLNLRENFERATEAHTKFSCMEWYEWSKPLQLEIDGEDVVAWNDQIANSAEEVIDLLRMTALKIRTTNDTVSTPTPEKVSA